MSIFATLLLLDDELFGGDEGLGAPFLYRASHLFPDGERGGSLEIAAIPGFIEHDGIPAAGGETEDRVHPWLRIGLDDNGDGNLSVTKLLNRAQVERVRDVLAEWLQRGTDT